jgi:uncharacterized protein (DUF1330 family)
MSYYIVANIKIEDPAEYSKYQDGFLEVFEKYKGEVLCVSDEPVVVEGDWPYTRVVVLRFPAQDDALAWYASPEYQAIVKHRVNASTAAIVSAPGFDGF